MEFTSKKVLYQGDDVVLKEEIWKCNNVKCDVKLNTYKTPIKDWNKGKQILVETEEKHDVSIKENPSLIIFEDNDREAPFKYDNPQTKYKKFKKEFEDMIFGK